MSGIEDKQDKEKKIESELNRLSKNYAGISDKTRAVIRGLLQRAAFMRVELADLEDDLITYGWTEWFSQGEQEPYQRKRPTAELYNTVNSNYQKIIKQLTDLLPKDGGGQKQEEGDGFDDFVEGREDA